MTTVEAPTRPRVDALDAVRGLAILAMVLDHLALLVGWDPVRFTVGRLAMPLFFVLAGGLVTRVTRRHAHAFGLGVLLPVLVPWSGSPNVLVVFAVGAVLLVAFERAGVTPAWLVVLSLALAANRWEVGTTSYDPSALIALMAFGRMIGTGWALELGERWRGLGLEAVGRRPLLWYVGNVLAIQGVGLWLSRVS